MSATCHGVVACRALRHRLTRMWHGTGATVGRAFNSWRAPTEPVLFEAKSVQYDNRCTKQAIYINSKDVEFDLQLPIRMMSNC